MTQKTDRWVVRALVFGAILCAVVFWIAGGLAQAQTYRDSAGTVVPGFVLVDPTGKGPLGTVANPLVTTGGGQSVSFPLGPTTVPSQALSITVTGTLITGYTIPSGGQGLSGILSSIDTDVRQPLAAGSAIIGNVRIDQTTPGANNVQSISGTTGGQSNSSEIVPNNTTGVSVKASAGTLYGLQLVGVGSAPAYVKIYDTASAPTCGSGTPIKRLIIPAAPTAANGAGSNITFGASGILLANGLGYCVTTGIADNDTTAPAASTYLVNMDYK